MQGSPCLWCVFLNQRFSTCGFKIGLQNLFILQHIRLVMYFPICKLNFWGKICTPVRFCWQTRNRFESTRSEVESLMRKMKENPHEHKSVSQHTMEGYLFVQEKRKYLCMSVNMFRVITRMLTSKPHTTVNEHVCACVTRYSVWMLVAYCLAHTVSEQQNKQAIMNQWLTNSSPICWRRDSSSVHVR